MIKTGDFIRYEMKNEVGLVKRVEGDKIRAWWHLGGTSAIIDKNLTKRLSLSEVLNEKFTNDYCKESLLERKVRLNEGGDVSDLIDERHIRKNLRKEFYENSKR